MAHTSTGFVSTAFIGIISAFAVGSTDVLADQEPSPQPLNANAAVASVDGKPIPWSALRSATEIKLAKLKSDKDAEIIRLSLGEAREREEYLFSELGKLIDDRDLALEAAARKT